MEMGVGEEYRERAEKSPRQRAADESHDPKSVRRFLTTSCIREDHVRHSDAESTHPPPEIAVSDSDTPFPLLDSFACGFPLGNRTRESRRGFHVWNDRLGCRHLCSQLDHR